MDESKLSRENKQLKEQNTRLIGLLKESQMLIELTIQIGHRAPEKDSLGDRIRTELENG